MNDGRWPQGITVYESVTRLKARRGPREEKFALVRSNMKLYRFVSGNSDTDDSATTADTIEPTGGYTGRWKAFGFVSTSQADDVGALTDSTTGTATSTVGDVGAAFSQATLNDNFATLADRINDLRTALRDAGLMA